MWRWCWGWGGVFTVLTLEHPSSIIVSKQHHPKIDLLDFQQPRWLLCKVIHSFENHFCRQEVSDTTKDALKQHRGESVVVNMSSMQSACNFHPECRLENPCFSLPSDDKRGTACLGQVRNGGHL